MSTPTNILDELRRDEGDEPKPYTDTTGNVTIGIGINLSDGLSEFERKFLFRNRLALNLEGLPPWMAAIIDMCYNLGPEKFTEFKDFMMYIRSGQPSYAARDLRQSLAYKQDTARYERLAKQIETDTWQ